MSKFKNLSPEKRQLRIMNCGVMAARRVASAFSGESCIGMSMERCNELISKKFKIEIPKNKKQYRFLYGKMYMNGQFGEIAKDLKGAYIYEVGRHKVKPTRKAESKKTAAKPKTREFHPFYDSDEWLTLKRKILRLYGTRCMQCGAVSVQIHVDHIKPRSKYKHLELEPSNLQVLCFIHNMEKSNKNENDYRPEWAKTFDFTKL